MSRDEPSRRSSGHGSSSVGVFCAAAIVGLAAACGGSAEAAPLTVDVYNGDFATVNSFLFSNGKSLVLLDAQRKTVEARKLAELIRSKRLPLTHILISHGHTDHFTGMAYLHEQFPDAKIVVASEAIRGDIKAYAVYMDSGGETGAEPALEPALRPRTEQNPAGFDYEQVIGVLPSRTLRLGGGGTLELTIDYPATEALHMTTVYAPQLNALFLADLGYNRVHLWMGDDITLARVAAWRATLLKVEARYAPRHSRIYPGHGEPTDMSLSGVMVRCIDDYTGVVTAAHHRDEATRNMKALYPDWRQADFFLKHSVAIHVHE